MTEAVISGILKHRVRLVFVIKIIIAAGLIVYLAEKVSLHEISVGLQNANPVYLSIALLLTVVNLYLQYIKWRITCRYLLEDERKGRILTSLFYGIAAGSFTPARVGEYFGRGAAFKDKPLLQISIATFIDKIFPLFMTAFFGSLATILFAHYYYGNPPIVTASLFIIYFLLFYILIAAALNPRFWNNFLFRTIKRSKHLHKFLKNFMILKEVDRFYTVEMLFFSFLFYTCFILQYAFLAAAFSAHPDFLKFIWAANLIMFVKTVIPPVSVGELGIREGASVFFITRFGDTPLVGFNASIFLFFINILLPSVIGMFLLMKRNDE